MRPRYRKVLEVVDDALIGAIGPPPKVGRNKWQALAEALRADKNRGSYSDKSLKLKYNLNFSSDMRFELEDKEFAQFLRGEPARIYAQYRKTSGKG